MMKKEVTLQRDKQEQELQEIWRWQAKHDVTRLYTDKNHKIHTGKGKETCGDIKAQNV